MAKLIEVYTQSKRYGTTHYCERCGRQHDKVFVIQYGDEQHLVGSTCCKLMFGWKPGAFEIKRAELEQAAREMIEFALTNPEFTVIKYDFMTINAPEAYRYLCEQQTAGRGKDIVISLGEGKIYKNWQIARSTTR